MPSGALDLERGRLRVALCPVDQLFIRCIGLGDEPGPTLCQQPPRAAQGVDPARLTAFDRFRRFPQLHRPQPNVLIWAGLRLIRSSMALLNFHCRQRPERFRFRSISSGNPQVQHDGGPKE